MIQKKYTSVKSSSDPHPWYDIEIDNGLPRIALDNDGGTDFDMGGSAPKTAEFAELPEPAKQPLPSNAVYAVTESGEYIAYEAGANLSEHGISLRAHLAWYNSDTDEFTVLEFVEA